MSLQSISNELRTRALRVSGLKVFYGGTEDTSFDLQSLPVLIIGTTFTSADEPKAQQLMYEKNISLGMQLIIAKTVITGSQTYQNTFHDATILLRDLLNEFDMNSSNQVDIQLNRLILQSDFTYEIEYFNETIVFNITLNAITQIERRGART